MTCREEKRNAHRILVGTPEGKRLLGRPKRRFADNIKPNLKEMGWRAVFERDKWPALVNTAINI